MRSQRIGHGFESRYLHHKQRKSNRLVRLFSCLRRGYKGHLTRGACCACRHAARDRANGLVISASLSRQRSLKGESRYLHHANGSVFTGPFFYLCVVEMKGASHPWGMLRMPPRCTLAQMRVYMKHGWIAKRFSGDGPFPCALSSALFRFFIWRVLERRGETEPLVYSSIRHGVFFCFFKLFLLTKTIQYDII